MIPTIGLHENVDFQTYLEWEALSQSLLKEITRSPGHLAYRRENPMVATPAMILGSAVDCLLFDGGEAFHKQYVTAPVHFEELPDFFIRAPDPLPTKPNGEPYKDYWASKGGKDWKAEQDAKGLVIVKLSDWNGGGLNLSTTAGQAWKQYAEREGLTVLSRGDIQRVKDTVEAIHHDENAYTMIHAGKAQLSIVWRDEETQVLCKGRLDLYLPSNTETDAVGALIIDLKTTDDADPEAFARKAHGLRYHWQAAYYCDGMTAITREPHDEFTFIVAERDPPHRVEVMRLGISEMELGRAEYRMALQLYADSVRDNSWPTSTGTVQKLEFPGWAFK